VTPFWHKTMDISISNSMPSQWTFQSAASNQWPLILTSQCKKQCTLSVSRWRVKTCSDVLIYKANINIKVNNKNMTISSLECQKNRRLRIKQFYWNTYKMPPKFAIWLHNWEPKRSRPSHWFIFTSNYLSCKNRLAQMYIRKTPLQTEHMLTCKADH
jgi:hypothetical protein